MAAMDKLMRKAGAARVSDSAKEALADVLEDIGVGLSTEALTFSQHAGRKTIIAADIKLASRKK